MLSQITLIPAHAGALLAGFVIGSCALWPFFATLLFAVPEASRLKRTGMLKSSRPVLRRLAWNALQTLLLAPALYFAPSLLGPYTPSFYVGVLLAALGGLARCGANARNHREFFKRFGGDLDFSAASKAAAKHARPPTGPLVSARRR